MGRDTRRLICSTGTMVSRYNGYDYKRALGVIRDLYERGKIDGAELMMLHFYYDKFDEVTRAVNDSGVPFPVIHCEKDVGMELSDAGVLFADGKTAEAVEMAQKSLGVFRYNCRFGKEIGSELMVLHLWGGFASDTHVDFNCRFIGEMTETAKEYGLTLLVENIPSTTYDPLSNWHRVLDACPDAKFIFDTRFGALHDQAAEILSDREITDRLLHVHVSDFVGGYRNFKALRPIPHPGEGVVDFDLIANGLDAIDYGGTITLESPVVNGTELDTAKLERTFEYMNGKFR
ncbi:MAG: sugar phosphate isomerase/epimerase [Clostridia bacterium]|nr:sugar phosphate isomerase/epimerase [Clostridia bacterium]